MYEVPVLVISRFDKLRNDNADILACELLVVLIHQPAYQSSIVLLEDDIVKYKVIDAFIYLSK